MLQPSGGEALHTCQGERWVFLAVMGVVLGGWRAADAFLGNKRGCEELPPAMASQLKERTEMEMAAHKQLFGGEGGWCNCCSGTVGVSSNYVKKDNCTGSGELPTCRST